MVYHTSLNDFHLESRGRIGDPKVRHELLKSEPNDGGGGNHVPGPSAMGELLK